MSFQEIKQMKLNRLLQFMYTYAALISVANFESLHCIVLWNYLNTLFPLLREPLLKLINFGVHVWACVPSLFIIHIPDRDECAASLDNCEMQCINTFGSFSCSCSSGYSLASDGRQCLGKLLIR